MCAKCGMLIICLEMSIFLAVYLCKKVKTWVSNYLSEHWYLVSSCQNSSRFTYYKNHLNARCDRRRLLSKIIFDAKWDKTMALGTYWTRTRRWKLFLQLLVLDAVGKACDRQLQNVGCEIRVLLADAHGRLDPQHLRDTGDGPMTFSTRLWQFTRFCNRFYWTSRLRIF